MRELNKTRRLTIAVVVFTVIILIGLITIKQPEHIYELSRTEMLEKLNSGGNEIQPQEALNLLKQENHRFIDLRNETEFFQGHVEGAVNVPAHSLLEKENLKMFEDQSITNVLYGNDHLKANGPYMVLSQLGLENIKILSGGYSAYLPVANGDSIALSSNWMAEKPQFDYATILQEAIDRNIKEAEEAKKVKPVQKARPAARKPKQKTVKLLPKPVVEEEEEEEGC